MVFLNRLNKQIEQTSYKLRYVLFYHSSTILSSLKTLVQDVATYPLPNPKLQRLTSAAKMINWKQARWHSCFDSWARLRPVVQAVGLAAKWSERKKWAFDIDGIHVVSDSSARVGQCPC